MHCNKCEINWQKLAELDNGNDAYYYCPSCHSDLYLTDKIKGDAYICLPNGKIINWITKEPLITEAPQLPAITAKATSFNMDEWLAAKDKAREDDDARIAHYIHVFETQGQEQALQAYTNYKRQ